MDISANGQVVKTITDTEFKIITYMINADIFDDDMERRWLWANECNWPGENGCKCIIKHKIERNIERLRRDWQERIENPAEDDTAFCEQVFAHPDYKDKKTREDEEAAAQAEQAQLAAELQAQAELQEQQEFNTAVNNAVEVKLRELGILGV